MSARLAAGDKVRVRTGEPGHHVRTPGYLMGQRGTVTRLLGQCRNPETLAYGHDGLPKLVLYRVRFTQASVWPDYAGARGDTLEVEVYENWLEETP